MTSIGDEAQLQLIADRIGKAAASIAIREFVQTHPHFETPTPSKPETPAYVKWGAGIGATLVAAAIIWMAATLNQLQITVARIDERQITDTTKADVRDLQRRVTALEQGAPK